MILLGWNIILTALFLKIISHYRRLTRGVDKENLEKVLENILRRVEGGEKRVDSLEGSSSILQKEGVRHFQKMGLVKFNPFSDMGGSQSFSLAMLDGKNSGLVITGLHGRSLTHLYIKEIREGRALEGKLSKEEELAIKQCFKKGKNEN